MADFSHMPYAIGYFAPSRFEAEMFDCEVRGTIPADLDGAFYRMHGDFLYPPLHVDDASLSADGYISMFRIKGGSVDYRGRYVRTPRYEAQRAARRQLYGYYRNPFTDDPSVRNLEDPSYRAAANTTPVVHAGKLYATKEDGPAFEMDPNTLDTLGIEDFGGGWKSQTFTAHPKVDPVTGEMIAFGYEASGLASTDVFLTTIAKDGKIKSEMRFDVPHVTMLHDIAITEKHIVLPGSSAVTSLERLQEGKVHWGWDSSVGSYYGIIPRDGDPRDIRWFHGPDRSIVHVANAWTEGDKVYLDLPIADGNTWPFFPDINGGSFTMNTNRLRRLTFDLAANSDEVHEELLFDQEVTSFTRIDERFTSKPNRYIYVQYSDRSKPFEGALPEDEGRSQPNNSIGRFDLQSRTLDSFFAGPSHVLQEPVFVPRKGSVAEGDGYLLATVHNLAAMRAELVIVDAPTMTELARVLLPFRNPNQIHATWADADQLPLS